MQSRNNGLSKDLAEYGQPISNLFVQPNTAKEWEPYMLTRQQIADQ